MSKFAVDAKESKIEEDAKERKIKLHPNINKELMLKKSYQFPTELYSVELTKLLGSGGFNHVYSFKLSDNSDVFKNYCIRLSKPKYKDEERLIENIKE